MAESPREEEAPDGRRPESEEADAFSAAALRYLKSRRERGPARSVPDLPEA